MQALDVWSMHKGQATFSNVHHGPCLTSAHGNEHVSLVQTAALLQVWVVSSFWLIVVPWITCLAWRLAFLRSFTEVPRVLRERCNVLAVATDCIQVMHT